MHDIFQWFENRSHHLFARDFKWLRWRCTISHFRIRFLIKLTDRKFWAANISLRIPLCVIYLTYVKIVCVIFSTQDFKMSSRWLRETSDFNPNSYQTDLLNIMGSWYVTKSPYMHNMLEGVENRTCHFSAL